jgi:hypothetical protein
MFHFKRQPEKLPFWHDKLFTLEWDLPNVKWVLIHYVNGQSKPWYKKVERSYRFRRWFIRKPKGTFSNIANFRRPFVEAYLFSHWISIPKKVVIPLHVNYLNVDDLPLQTSELSLEVSPQDLQVELPIIQLIKPVNIVKLRAPEVVLSPNLVLEDVPSNFPICHWNLAEMHERNLLNDNFFTFDSVEKITNRT